MSEMEFTGERFITNYDSPQINYEHWHRYLLAASYVKGKTVVDIACGEGYGSHLLAQTAESVVGVDISQETITFARQQYQRKNLTFERGSVTSIPLVGEQQVDVVVSFETIEHVAEAEQQAFLQEIKRLLKPDGLLMISTPNKLLYSDLPKYKNEFHVKEFYFREFKAFLQAQFKQVKMLGQRIYSGSFIWPLEESSHQPNQDFQLQFDQTLHPTTQPKSDLYNLALCSDQEISQLMPSTLVDLSDRLIQQKDETIGELYRLTQEQEARIKQLTADVQTARVQVDPEHAAQHAAQQIKVSIVIPVFNKVAYTRQCLEAVAAHTPGDLFELIMVDNASSDETPELLQALAGDVKIIRNQENRGFVEACNQGAVQAAGEYILFLNNDTIPLAGWLEALVALADRDSAIGAVGAKLIYPNGQLQEAGGLIFKDGSGWNFGRLDDPEKAIYNEICQVDYCSGAALMVRSDLFTELGGFDQRYAPAYYEDTDLCFALRAMGYAVMYCPQAAVIHCEGITAGTDLTQGFKQHQVINQKKFVAKWQTALDRQEVSPQQSKHVPTTADRVKRGLEQPLLSVLNTPQTSALRVLVIDPILPRYDRASGSLRLFNILKILLATGCEVTYIARNGVRQEQYKRELEDMGITVYATDPEKMAALDCHLEAEKINLPKILEAGQFHLAWLSFYDIAEQYLPEIRKYSPRTTIMIDTVDVHFLRETRQAALLQDDQLAAQARATKERELTIYQQADWLMTVTEEDKQVLLDHIDKKDIIVLPNIHARQPEGAPFSDRHGLLFVGNFNHPPNGDAMTYFCQQVFPKVKAAIPDMKLSIVGANPPEEVKALANDAIEVTGYVIETEPYLRTHRLSIAPLRYGAGMKGKIGEALSHGVPVVTSSIGAEGMGLVHDQQVLIADEATDMAKQILRLYQDQELWQILANNGREHIENHYGFTAVTAIVEAIKARLLNTGVKRKPQVSIVILTHNQLAYTQRCLESIIEHTEQDYELIIVDNHSTDGTVAYLKKLQSDKSDWPQCTAIRVIANHDNLGFARGNNQGLVAAQGQYVLLLNNDTVVTKNWLTNMLRTMNHKPKVGIVGPMSNYVSGPQLIQSVGYDVTSLRGLPEYVESLLQNRQEQARPYWRVVGFCMLIKRAVIDKIGGLDGRFGLGNFEDDDFSLRAALAGFESWIAEDSFVHHFGSQTFKTAKIDYQASLNQNWKIFKRKWNIPDEVKYGEPYEMTTLIQQQFATRHVCPLEEATLSPAEQTISS